MIGLLCHVNSHCALAFNKQLAADPTLASGRLMPMC